MSSPREAFASAATPTAQEFSRTGSGFVGEDVPMTSFEHWAVKRSDDSFRGLAGATAGIMSGIITCPLDVIKTKLQAQGAFRQPTNGRVTKVQYSGLLGTGRVIWKEEGLKGMYRGLGPIILGYLPTWAVYFTIYGGSKEYFAQHHENPYIVNTLSSIVAGASSTMVTNPIWVIKTRLMSQVSRKATSNEARPPWHYTSTLDAARKMYKTEGLLSFYSGLTPALLGLTHVAVQFPTYEYLKKSFTGKGMGQSVDEESDWVGIFSASVISKVIASSATYPHEVIRTRLQTQQRSLPHSSGFEGQNSHGTADIVEKAKTVIPRYRGVVTTFKTILREEGWRAFYAGMGTNMMRAVPAATTTMVTYEYVMRQFTHAKSEGERKSSSHSW